MVGSGRVCLLGVLEESWSPAEFQWNCRVCDCWWLCLQHSLPLGKNHQVAAFSPKALEAAGGVARIGGGNEDSGVTRVQCVCYFVFHKICFCLEEHVSSFLHQGGAGSDRRFVERSSCFRWHQGAHSAERRCFERRSRHRPEDGPRLGRRRKALGICIEVPSCERQLPRWNREENRGERSANSHEGDPTCWRSRCKLRLLGWCHKPMVCGGSYYIRRRCNGWLFDRLPYHTSVSLRRHCSSCTETWKRMNHTSLFFIRFPSFPLWFPVLIFLGAGWPIGVA